MVKIMINFETLEGFDTTTLNAGVVLDTLNEYKGDNIWEDVICVFDFEVIPAGDYAFTMKDEDGDIVKFFYQDHSKEWTYEVQ